MQQAFLDVNGVRTSVKTWGRWVEESPKNDGPEEIIILIPGNPGLSTFYHAFLGFLYNLLQIPVWTLSHAGHEMPKENTIYPMQPLKGNENLFGLQGQVDHKIAFVEKYVPKNAKIHLIGHSIGAYIVVEMLKAPSVQSRVKHNFLLFPTIENMADTPNGKFMNRFIRNIVPVILFAAWISTILPKVISNFILYVYMKVTFTPKSNGKAIKQLINPTILEKVFFMAYQELDFVKQRCDSVIRDNLSKISLLYSVSDGWAPPALYDKIKADFPNINAKLISELEHAFVIKQNEKAGRFIGDWINEIRQK